MLDRGPPPRRNRGGSRFGNQLGSAPRRSTHPTLPW